MSFPASNDELPWAIVVGLDCITGLQTARILARRGVSVVGIAKTPNHYCCRTRACRRVLTADTGGESLLQVLSDLGPQLARRAVLFPCTDPSVLVISRDRQRLEPWYHLSLPEHPTVELLMDKQRFLEFAGQQGLPIPQSHLLRNRQDAEQAAQRLVFPALLKPPLKTPRWESQTRAKAYRVDHAEEFLELYDRCSQWASPLMVQEWIAGGDSNLYSCNGYWDAASQPLATFVARKLRQWPPNTGTSCLGEECRNDAVLRQALRLFQSVGYRGLGYLEMKRDERTGQHVIIEPNVGRPTGRSAIAEAGGVELLYTMYCDCAGLPLPPDRQQTYRAVKWIYWRHDLQSAFHYWRQGELNLRQWWRSVRGRKACAVYCWTDPKPFLADLWRALKLAWQWRPAHRTAGPEAEIRPAAGPGERPVSSPASLPPGSRHVAEERAE